MNCYRYTALLMGIALSACASPTREATTTRTDDTNHAKSGVCDARTLSWTVGLVADDALVERARKEAGATTIRVLRPGMMITNDVNPARLNLRMDNARKILVYSCG